MYTCACKYFLFSSLSLSVMLNHYCKLRLGSQKCLRECTDGSLTAWSSTFSFLIHDHTKDKVGERRERGSGERGREEEREGRERGKRKGERKRRRIMIIRKFKLLRRSV